MQKDSRIRISGLSEETAVKLMQVLRRDPLLKGGTRFELDHPDPPDLLETEYARVNNAVCDLAEFTSEIGDYGEATKKSEVVADLKRMRKQFLKAMSLVDKFEAAIIGLDSALKKLK